METYQYKNITSAQANSNVAVSTLPGATLAFITVNKTSAHAIGIYDGTDTTTLANNTLIGTLVASVAVGTYTYKVNVAKGLVLSIPSGYVGDMTICYR